MLGIRVDRTNRLWRPLSRRARVGMLALGLVAIPVSAFAAWIVLAANVSAAITTPSMGPYPIVLVTTTGACTATFVGSDVTVSWPGADEGQVCGLGTRIANNGSALSYFRYVSVGVAPEVIAAGTNCGISIGPGTDNSVNLELTLDPVLAGPNATYSPTYSVEASLALPACPSP